MFGFERPFSDNIEEWERYRRDLGRARAHAKYLTGSFEFAESVVAWLKDPQGTDPREIIDGELGTGAHSLAGSMARIKRALQADKD